VLWRHRRELHGKHVRAGRVLPLMIRPKSPAPTNHAARVEALLDKLAHRVRTLRERKGLTQEEFARRCGISVSFASLLERGRRSPSYETLILLAEALEMPVADLFRDIGGAPHEDPYLGRLMDFARGARLTRPQVDKLIQLAQLVFDVQPDRKLPALRPRGDVCSVERCGRPVLAKGLCASHYHRQRRARAKG
jgi:DNA-binding XRE family transcriptional regulator